MIVELMVNAGRPETKILSDGWTAVTKDKSPSAQFEHTLGRNRGRRRSSRCRRKALISHPTNTDPPRSLRTPVKTAGVLGMVRMLSGMLSLYAYGFPNVLGRER